MKPSPVSEHDHVDGPADAPVTLIEYGDYECPFCVKAFPVLEAVRQEFSGKLRFVYRHFPKSGESFAKQAAEVSEFAAAQGKFWPMHAQLFTQGGQLDTEHLVAAATAAGLDGEACRQSLTLHSFTARVRELSVASVRSGIIGTPTVFINGVHHENRLDQSVLSAAIRSALGTANVP